MASKSAPDDLIVIGIDFETTWVPINFIQTCKLLIPCSYSGVAWAYSRAPEEIELVTSWDSELNHCSDVEKTPS